MKQEITVEQLNELSPKNLIKIKRWALKRHYYADLSIGQMIEFLEEHTGGNDFDIRIHSAGSGWKKPGQRLVDINGLPVNEIEDEEELCDALWEAVKEVLENEK